MTKRIVIGVIGVALVLLVVVRIIQASGNVAQDPDVSQIRQRTGIPVEIATARVGPIVVRREYTGTVRGIRSATIRAKTGDEIVAIPVRVGQHVSAGDVVIRQSSEGSMASVQQAEAAWEQARRSVDRLRPLREEGAISEQDWDNAVTALDVAQANLEAARRAVQLISPIDGIVTDILETRGTMPSAGDPLVRISDLSRVQVLLQMSPEQATELSLGQAAFLPAQGLEGTVSRIALQADPESRLLEVELTFPGTRDGAMAGRTAVPGTLVTAQVVVGKADSALLVPPIAVREGAVWVIDSESIAHRRPVTTGMIGEEDVQIIEGLSAGDRVVTAGASLLSDGAQTRIVGG